jgi:hypothetical protein
MESESSFSQPVVPASVTDLPVSSFSSPDEHPGNTQKSKISQPALRITYLPF